MNGICYADEYGSVILCDVHLRERLSGGFRSPMGRYSYASNASVSALQCALKSEYLSEAAADEIYAALERRTNVL